MRTPSPPSRRRWTAPPILLAVLSLLVAGCQVRVDTGIDLREDDTAVVDLTVGIRFDEGLPPEVTAGVPEEGISPEDAREGIEESAAACGFDAGLATVEPYEPDDGFTGVSIRLDGIPIEAVNCFFGEESDTQFFTEFDISRDGDEFVFTAATADLTSELQQGLGGDVGDVGDALGEDVAEALANPGELFDITIGVTFPGEIIQENATRVEATTAVWEIEGGATTLMARGAAGGGGDLAEILPWILIGLAVLVALGLIIYLIARGRRKEDVVAAGQWQPGQPPGGAPPGGVPPGGAPPGAAWQPGQPAGGPPPGWGQQPQPPAQSQPPSQPQPPGPPGQGGDANPDATRTFRPEDLLPPQDPPPDR